MYTCVYTYIYIYICTIHMTTTIASGPVSYCSGAMPWVWKLTGTAFRNMCVYIYIYIYIITYVIASFTVLHYTIVYYTLTYYNIL